MFLNQGEVCSAGSRILVERPIYKNFLDAMVEKARKIRLGPGIERDTQMGPVQTTITVDSVSPLAGTVHLADYTARMEKGVLDGQKIAGVFGVRLTVGLRPTSDGGNRRRGIMGVRPA